MNDYLISNGCIEIFTQSFGEPSNPAVLLIMGATAQAAMWETSFCEVLAEHNYFVIRYDHRDTGQSSRIDYDSNPYDLNDLADDILTIIKSYQLTKVHLVGASMGSFLAQHLAIKHPAIVSSLTCIMSSPNHLVFVDGFLKREHNHDLPTSHPKILEFYENIIALKPKSSDEAEELYKRAWIALTNSHHQLETRIFEGKILRRLQNPKYIHNHSLALANSPSMLENLHLITAPTLIIHGEDDYILPLEHGIKLSQLIKHSQFISIPNMGHCFDQISYDIIANALLNFFKS